MEDPPVVEDDGPPEVDEEDVVVMAAMDVHEGRVGWGIETKVVPSGGDVTMPLMSPSRAKEAAGETLTHCCVVWAKLVIKLP